MSDPVQQARIGIDAAAGSTLVAAIANEFLTVLPTVMTLFGAFLSIVWFSIQIRESATMQDYLARRRERIRTRKLRRLMAKQKIIQAKILAADTVTKARITATAIVASAKTDAALTTVQDKNVDAHNE